IEQEPENPRAWLFHVASNLARDESRTVLRRRKHLTLLKGEAEAAPPAAAVDEELEHRERAAMVRAALEKLADRDREVLQLWDAGLNYAEISAQTGLAAGSIGTTLARARQRLAEAYH